MVLDFTRPQPGSSPAVGAPTAKLTLTKDRPRLSLAKSGIAGGQLRVNLRWLANQKRGMFGAHGPSVDLDLGAMVELTDGTKHVVQALGNSFGRIDAPPFVMLDGDDRSGTSDAGENLLVNLNRSADIARVLVFAYIYEGAAAFDTAAGVVTLYPASGPEIEVRLDEHAGSRRMCAIALLENVSGQLEVRREVNYIAGMHSELDRAYGFGFSWTAGTKG